MCSQKETAPFSSSGRLIGVSSGGLFWSSTTGSCEGFTQGWSEESTTGDPLAGSWLVFVVSAGLVKGSLLASLSPSPAGELHCVSMDDTYMNTWKRDICLIFTTFYKIIKHLFLVHNNNYWLFPCHTTHSLCCSRTHHKILGIGCLRNSSQKLVLISWMDTQICISISDRLLYYVPCEWSYSCKIYHAMLKRNIVMCIIILYMCILCIVVHSFALQFKRLKRLCLIHSFIVIYAVTSSKRETKDCYS